MSFLSRFFRGSADDMVDASADMPKNLPLSMGDFRMPMGTLDQVVSELVARGYPEGTAIKIATGDLPMDEASRLARAKAMGADDTVTYHHGPEGIKEFRDPDPEIFSKHGPAIYSSPDRDYGKKYVEGLDNPDVYELVTLGPIADRDMVISLDQEAADLAGSRGHGPYWQAMNHILKEKGYSGSDVWGERQTFSPENLRDARLAAFDPEQRRSRSLLASRPEVGVASVLSADNFDEARAALNEEEGYQYFDVLPIRKNLMGREQPYEFAMPNIVREPMRALLDLSEQLETGERSPAKAMGLLF